MRALFVDDEVEFLQLMEKRLSRRGLTVQVAASAEAALELLQNVQKSEQAFQIVVMDVSMPGMNGIEALSRMKELYPDLPIILLTGHACIDFAVRGMELGAFDYMLKPVAINELLIKMEDAVRSAE